MGVYDAERIQMPALKIINGRPTGNQAKPLVERFKTMQSGDTITHTEIAQIIGEPYGTHRHKTVFIAARKKFFQETGIWLCPVWGTGYQYPVGGDQMRHGIGKTRKGVRAIRRGTEILGSVADERLSEPERKVRDFTVDRSRMLYEYAKQESRKLLLNVGKPETLPTT